MSSEPLTKIPAGSSILLDANILIYALIGTSAQCFDLLKRCDAEEVSGFTTVEVINEVCHRQMLAEAFGKGLIQRPNAAALKRHRHAIKQLGDYWIQVTRIL